MSRDEHRQVLEERKASILDSLAAERARWFVGDGEPHHVFDDFSSRQVLENHFFGEVLGRQQLKWSSTSAPGKAHGPYVYDTSVTTSLLRTSHERC